MTVSASWRLRTRSLSMDRTLLMGVVNVTPDSFSDGGQFLDPDRAAAHGRQLASQGADIIDVGGESTRPGAEPVTAEEEEGRVLPVVESLARGGLVVSIDTIKPAVAKAAIEAGAEIVNDVMGLRDPGMIELCARAGVGVVIVHAQGTPRTMQDSPSYRDVVEEVSAYLQARAGEAEEAGVPRDSIAVDPGIGFGKTIHHNLALLDRLDRVVDLGYPVAVGASRKTFLGTITGHARPEDRDHATAVTVALAVDRGAQIVRVHEVALAREAAAVAGAIVRSRSVSEQSAG